MIFRNLNITLIESDIAWADKAANLSRLRDDFARLPSGTDIVVLPELFSTGFICRDFERAVLLREGDDGETLTLVRELSRRHGVAVAGSFIGVEGDYLRNRAFFVEPSGDTTFYNKRHLFTMAGEQVTYRPGSSAAPVVRFRGMNFKLVTCYDLRFPVFCRNRRSEYDVLLVVANWPLPRQRAWRTLLEARALENLCYVCGVNRSGKDADGVDYGSGSSVVVDFKGRAVVCSQHDDGNEASRSQLVSATLSREELEAFREKFPAHRDADDFTLML